ncbi:unnamed protein product [Heterobilharzia americana]|nr:unnamed protein product [Heterobilharzia americana]
MLNICLFEWSWCNVHQRFQIVLIFFCINVIESRTVRLQIDEELTVNTQIGNLFNNVQGGISNLRFVKISNIDDSSAFFSVDQFSGDITIARRLDRETLCIPGGQVNKNEIYENSAEEWAPSLSSTSKCELYFSVNCLNTTPILNLSNPSRAKTPVSNKLVAIFDVVVEIKDINDNGCNFMPSSEQTVHIREDSSIHSTRITLNTPYDPDDATLGNTVLPERVWIHTESSRGTTLTDQNIKRTFKLHSLSSSKNTTTSNVNLELELIKALDFEQQKNFTFQVVADDGFPSGDHQCRLNVTILVEDCNDHIPVFEQTTYVANVSEDTPIGHPVIQIKANDADEGENGKVLYGFDSSTDNVDDSNLFYVHPDTGEIKLQRRLNYRQRHQHTLQVIAKNPDETKPRRMQPFQTLSKSSTTQVIINVIDINDHFPRIRILSPTGSKSLELLEESPPGQDIGILDVSDGDTGKNAEVNCRLTNQTVSDVLRLVPMNNGMVNKGTTVSNRKYKITLEKRIDREEYSVIEFTILCHDSGTPSLSSKLTQRIGIIDINDHDPVCEQTMHTVEITEDTDPKRGNVNFEIVKIHAIDKDIGQNAKLRFSLDQETPIHLLKLITVDSQSGILKTLGNLDREELDKFSITIVCSDHGEPERMTKAFINVNVLDYNDNPPVFSKPYFEFTMTENNLLGQWIGTIYVSDKDLGENAELEINIEENLETPHVHLSVLNNNLNLPNDIDQLRFISSGLITSSVIRQRKYTEYTSKFRLNTQKLTNRNNSLSVNQLTIIYEVKLYIESVIDRENLIMNNNNFLSEGSFNYKLYENHMNNNNNNYNNGLSSMLSRSNYSTLKPIIFLLIRAQDKGIPKLSEHISVRIHILDENDNSPHFIFPDSTNLNKTRVTVSYKEPVEYSFTQVQAIDDDAGENGTVSYFIHSGNDKNWFKLNKNNGVLSINKPIPYSAIGEHILRIEARDGGLPYRFTITELIIEFDQSTSKAYLTMDVYNFNGFSGFFNFGGSGNMLNFYIIIGIIISACIISIILIAFVFIFLHKNKTNRNFQHSDITIERNINNQCETQISNSPLGWQKIDQLQNYEFSKISRGYRAIHPIPDCLSQFSNNGGNSSMELLNYPNGDVYPSPILPDLNMESRNPPKYWSYITHNNNNNNTSNNNNIINSNSNHDKYTIHGLVNNQNDLIESGKIEIYIPSSHNTMKLTTTGQELPCTNFKYPYHKDFSNYFDDGIQQTIIGQGGYGSDFNQ